MQKLKTKKQKTKQNRNEKTIKQENPTAKTRLSPCHAYTYILSPGENHFNSTV